MRNHFSVVVVVVVVVVVGSHAAGAIGAIIVRLSVITFKTNILH